MSSKGTDGGPAFPRHIHASDGMTLRDYFAAAALPTLISEYFAANGPSFAPDHSFRNIPAHAYRMADAMIKARGEGQ